MPFCDPAIPLLGIYTKKTRIERDTCAPMFIAALFTIARTWKQPRCPSADKWIRKLWYIYAMELLSYRKKKNTFESVLMRWMKLEPIIQSEVSQKVLVAKSYLTLCDPMGCSPPGSSIHGISQARIPEWVAIPSPGDLPDPGIKPVFPASLSL